MTLEKKIQQWLAKNYPNEKLKKLIMNSLEKRCDVQFRDNKVIHLICQPDRIICIERS